MFRSLVRDEVFDLLIIELCHQKAAHHQFLENIDLMKKQGFYALNVCLPTSKRRFCCQDDCRAT